MKVELLALEEQDKELGDADHIQDHFCHQLGAMVAPNLNFIQAPSILCLQTLLRTVSDFCLLILLHIKVLTIQTNPFFKHSG